MKVTCLVLAICVYAVSALPHSSKIDVSLNNAWEDYKITYSKKYDEQFESVRRLIWEENLEKVRQHNLLYDLGHKSYALGMNEFADMTFAEYQAVFLGFRQSVTNSSQSFLPPLNMGTLPSEVDWRKKGYVTPIKDQTPVCGSCWAFSTTGSLEGQHFRKTGKLVSLSEQQLVDCSESYGNRGCGGGLMENAFKYIKDNGGLDTEESYPYQGRNGQCHFNPANVGATMTGFVDLPRGDEEALKQASATVGPISVAIDANHTSFHLYRHGVYDEPACSPIRLDHGVLVVGYGTQDGSDYWLVKNSWGLTWGMDGYIKMSRNKNNQCGIASQPTYPTV